MGLTLFPLQKLPSLCLFLSPGPHTTVPVTLAKGWSLDNPKEQCCPLPLGLLALLLWALQPERFSAGGKRTQSCLAGGSGNTQAPWTWHWSWLLAPKERGS